MAFHCHFCDRTDPLPVPVRARDPNCHSSGSDLGLDHLRFFACRSPDRILPLEALPQD